MNMYNKKMYKLVISLFSLSLLAGCSTNALGPITAGQDTYVISKQFASFASKEDDLLATIFSQANQHCASQKRYMKIEQLNEHVGFIGNDSKTTLIFSCLKEKQIKNEEIKKVDATKIIKTKTKAQAKKIIAPVKKQTFPQKPKLTNYAF